MALHSKTIIQRLSKDDISTIEFIKEAYWQEWGIDQNTTENKLKTIQEVGLPFHYTMHVEGEPVATGGVYHDVNLIKVEERLQKIRSLVGSYLYFTKP